MVLYASPGLRERETWWNFFSLVMSLLCFAIYEWAHKQWHFHRTSAPSMHPAHRKYWFRPLWFNSPGASFVKLIVKTVLSHDKGIRLPNSYIHLQCLSILIFEFCFETLRQLAPLTVKTKLCLSHLGNIYQLRIVSWLSLHSKHTHIALRGNQRE